MADSCKSAGLEHHPDGGREIEVWAASVPRNRGTSEWFAFKETADEDIGPRRKSADLHLERRL